MHAFFGFPLVRMFVGLLWVGAFIGIGSVVAEWLPGDLEAAAPLVTALWSLVGYAAFVRVVERRAVPELLGPGVLLELLAGLALGVGLFSSVMGVLALLGCYSVVGTNPWSTAVPALMLAIMAGVTEELMLRAVAFRILEGWLGSAAALALTAALFGLLHLGTPHATLLGCAAIALEAGILLAAAFMVTRRVWLAIGIHIAWNFTQGGVFGVATSGVEISGLLKGALTGPWLLTGGAFGAEASVVPVVVCLAAGIALLGLARRRGQFLPRRRVAKPEPTR
jgi:membrane protease YdiL (CAAX protease family)